MSQLTKNVSDLYDKELEVKVLGGLMSVSSIQFKDFRDNLSSDYFYGMKHRLVYEALIELDDSGEPTNDISVLHDKLRSKGTDDIQFLAELNYHCPVCPQVELQSLTLLLANIAQRRKLMQWCMKASQIAYSGGDEFLSLISTAPDQLADIANQNVTANISSMADAINELYKHIDDIAAGKIAGLPTGFSQIDSRGGIFFGDLCIVCAKSSVGKTTFVLSMALNAARAGYPGAIYSMEMRKLRLAAKFTASDSSVSSNAIMSRPLSQAEMESIHASVRELYDLPLYFDDNNKSTFDKIESSIRKMAKKKGIKFAVIDYLQILSTGHHTEQDEVSRLAEYARRCKNLADELGIAIIALSQLKRDNEDKPRKDRIYGSAEIESASDNIIALYRPVKNERSAKKYDYPYEAVDINGTCQVMMLKARNSDVYDFIIGFDEEHSRMYPLSGELPRTPIQAPASTLLIQDEEPF